MQTEEDLREALKVVVDPEIGINIVDLGLIYEVKVADGDAHVLFTLTSMGCPAGAQIETDIRDALTGIEGLSSVTTELTMTPPWGPDRMSDFARSALGFF